MLPIKQIAALLAGAGLVGVAFLSSAMEEEPKAVITKSGAQEVLNFPGHTVEVLSAGTTTPSDIAVMELTMPPKTLGAPPHTHKHEDEHFYVLEGEVTFLNGDTSVAAPAGTLVALPRGGWHGFWNKSDKPVRMLLMVSPSDFGSFFDEVVMTLQKENAQSPDQVGAIIGRVAASRGVTVDPSRFPPEALALIPK